jgi:hypothetical protein
VWQAAERGARERLGANIIEGTDFNLRVCPTLRMASWRASRLPGAQPIIGTHRFEGRMG